MMEMLAEAPRPEPSADLLAACRAGLTDALDEAEAAKSHSGWRGWFEASHADAMAGLASGRRSSGADFPGIHRGSILPAVVGPHGYRPASDSLSTYRNLESLDTTPGVDSRSTINIYARRTLPESIGSLRQTMRLRKYKSI